MKRKKYTHITPEERDKINDWDREKVNDKQMAKFLGKHRTTISREKKRNSKKDQKYNSRIAQKMKDKRYALCRTSKIARNKKLQRYIRKSLNMGWSPEQIAGRLKCQYPEAIAYQISLHSIYKWIYSNDQISTELTQCLPRKHRKVRHRKKVPRGSIKVYYGKKSIHDRPKFQDQIGHLEVDLMVGKNEYLLTINDKFTGYVVIYKLKNKQAELTAKTIIDALKELNPMINVKNITCDNGTEFNWYSTIEYHSKIDVYFADVAAPYQRGSNENLNGLIRRFYKKRTDFSKIEQKEIDKVQEMLNSRPRKRHNFLSPNEIIASQSRAP